MLLFFLALTTFCFCQETKDNCLLLEQYCIDSYLPSFSNRNIKVKDASGNFWVVRIPSEVSRELCCQEQEYPLLQWAFQENISCLYVQEYDLRNGLMISPYLSGRSCSASDFKDMETLQKSIQLLRLLHHSTTSPIKSEFDPLNRYNTTAKIAHLKGVIIDPEIHQLALKLKNLWDKVPNSILKALSCHNDPSPENFFLQNGNLYLHDWELASLNDPMWDLAHLATIARIDLNLILEKYNSPDFLSREKIIFFQAFILFNSIVWASLERVYPTTNFSKELVEDLYFTFLTKTSNWIESFEFQEAFKALLQGGK